MGTVDRLVEKPMVKNGDSLNPRFYPGYATLARFSFPQRIKKIFRDLSYKDR